LADSKVNTSRKKSTASKKKTPVKKARVKAKPDAQVNSKAGSKDSVQASKEASPASVAVDGAGGVEDSVTTKGSQDRASIPSNTGQGNSVTAWLAIIMSALALVAGGYAWYLTAVDSRINVGQQQNMTELLNQRINSFEAAQSDLEARISQLKSQLTESEANTGNRLNNIRNELAAQENTVREQVAVSQKTLSDQSNQFRTEFDALSDSIIKLRSELNRSIDSWTLEEIEQLVIIADQRLRFAGDTVMAIKALELASSRLEQIADPSLLALRQQVIADSQSLSALPQIDVVEILGRIVALGNSVDGLELAGDLKAPEVAASPGEDAGNSEGGSAEDTASGQQSTMDKYTQPIVDASSELLASLADLIQVEKNGESLKPVVSAHARQLIYERTGLLLESAQIALIRQEERLYRDRLSYTREWVEENFDGDSLQTGNWLDQLTEIESLPSTSTPHDITGSVDAVRKAIEEK
jgi:uroporphyrin-3 C-methyltransferase